MAAMLSANVRIARPAAPLRARVARSVASTGRRTVAVRAAAPRDAEAAKAAVVGALVAALSGAPLMEAAPAYAVVATPAQIAAAEKEGAARLAACTTAECRQVIEALNTKKLAKLKGENAPAVRAVAPKKVAKTVAAPPTPAPAAAASKPAPAAAASSGSAAAAQKAAAAKAAAKAAADKKAADAKKAVAKKAEEERKRRSKSGGTNPLFYTLGFVGKFAFAAGALAAPFIYLKKEEVIVDEAGAIDTEKAIKTITNVADTVPNREIVAAYGAGALIALGIVDGIINLPLLNVFIGAPVQILGFVSGLALAVRYLSEGKSPVEDAKKLAVQVNDLIPESLPKPLTDETVRSWK